ncbi:MAG: HesA/MoeB/ThiF family protein [Phycisphaerales bacterium]|nr:HesA/MoeB/ThiF family protein [Phycisphaerales bacterium]
MTVTSPDYVRFARQIAFRPFGLDGQKALSRGRVLIVGVGGLGSWVAELLARAGVGFLRLVDSDRVDLTNIHRQALYGAGDAADRRPKVEAAARRLRDFNETCVVESVEERLDRSNVDGLAGDVEVVVDGTDNFTTRFLLNDYCVKTGRPWIFAGAVRAEAQMAVILPGRTPCLRCLLEEPPPPCIDPDCRQAGVWGMAVAAIASFQAMEAIKILAGRLAEASPYLLKFDLWSNTLQRLHYRVLRQSSDCMCCHWREFEFLEP